ncbi:MAG: DUF134 domain-containing protein [Candidatus Methanospirareceae archaeon]
MPGRRRCRYVGFQPHFLHFAPRQGAESSGFDTDESILKVEELESIRLKDYLRLSQNEAAERMGVSQPTFHRILSEAHRKIAEALIEGKAIRIEGGNYMITREAACVLKMPCGRRGRYGRGRML